MEIFNDVFENTEKTLDKIDALSLVVKQLQAKADRPQGADHGAEIRAINNQLSKIFEFINNLEQKKSVEFSNIIDSREAIVKDLKRDLLVIMITVTAFFVAVTILVGISVSRTPPNLSEANKQRLIYLEKQVKQQRETNPKITERYFGK